MKVNIKAVTAGKLSQDQEQILRRISLVLVQHGFSVQVQHKVKKTKVYNAGHLKVG